MSDLQCAATAVVLAAGTAIDVDRLRGMRPAAVHAGPGAGDAAASLARALDLSREDLPDHARSTGGLTTALTELADEYRGECIAVVVSAETFGAMTRLVLPGVADRAVVEIDADGHRWAPWPPDVTDARGR